MNVINIYSLRKKTKSKKLLSEIEELIEYAASDEEDYRQCFHTIRDSHESASPELDKYLLSKGLNIAEKVILNFD